MSGKIDDGGSQADFDPFAEEVRKKQTRTRKQTRTKHLPKQIQENYTGSEPDSEPDCTWRPRYLKKKVQTKIIKNNQTKTKITQKRPQKRKNMLSSKDISMLKSNQNFEDAILKSLREHLPNRRKKCTSKKVKSEAVVEEDVPDLHEVVNDDAISQVEGDFFLDDSD